LQAISGTERRRKKDLRRQVPRRDYPATGVPLSIVAVTGFSRIKCFAGLAAPHGAIGLVNIVRTALNRDHNRPGDLPCYQRPASRPLLGRLFDGIGRRPPPIPTASALIREKSLERCGFPPPHSVQKHQI